MMKKDDSIIAIVKVELESPSKIEADTTIRYDNDPTIKLDNEFDSFSINSEDIEVGKVESDKSYNEYKLKEFCLLSDLSPKNLNHKNSGIIHLLTYLIEQHQIKSTYFDNEFSIFKENNSNQNNSSNVRQEVTEVDVFEDMWEKLKGVNGLRNSRSSKGKPKSNTNSIHSTSNNKNLNFNSNSNIYYPYIKKDSNNSCKSDSHTDNKIDSNKGQNNSVNSNITNTTSSSIIKNSPYLLKEMKDRSISKKDSFTSISNIAKFQE